ncbi:gluconate 2-dehydrogenase subunit 3-like protein [Gelidibacter sediminis]|uniref:Gluconate 2-dehydrogenase subunit 3-like protein n=1 Tax=Gelidibacter sediminis TaxID=1608710 RepID=A0A4R7Q6V1_9FLAO|nr:gluconate 2-dehydrogenase subunit 3 family protein [Gelidibacter sediminis]TDU43248.1 gluconate 2-dehydrogenase subunit 3-like protein [Gelidibacter sediminis]
MDRRMALKNMALSFGFAVSGATIISLFNSCSDEKPTLTSEFFKASDMYNIAQLVDFILPKTATVGAKDLNIAHFVDKMCQHVLDDQQQKEMRLGVAEFSKKFLKITGNSTTEGTQQDYELMLSTYFNVSKDQEKAVFEMLDSDYNTLSNAIKPDYHLYTFMTTVRELSLLGYYTSQTIMELDLGA